MKKSVARQAETLVKEVLNSSRKLKYSGIVVDPNPEIRRNDNVRVFWIERGSGYRDGIVTDKGVQKLGQIEIYYISIKFQNEINQSEFEAGLEKCWYSVNNPIEPVKISKIESISLEKEDY